MMQFDENLFINEHGDPYIADVTAMIDNSSVGIILYESEDFSVINERIDNLTNLYDGICLMFFDSKLKAEIESQIPYYCGLLCYDDAFGMGLVFRLFRKWETIVYRGLFWVIDGEVYSIKHRCLVNGDFIGAMPASQNGKRNLTHKKEWNESKYGFTKGKPYNYYPRGRVEIKNCKAKIFLNPDIITDVIIEKIKNNFSLKSLSDVKIIADGSKHYQYKK